MPSLFSISACAPTVGLGDRPVPAGGIGTGRFTLDARGRFRGWRLEPGLPERDEAVPQDRFGVWVRQGRQVAAWPLTGLADGAPYPQRRLFPFTWTDYTPTHPHSHTPTLRLESVSFSPLVPGESHLASLPLHVVAFRAHNAGDEPLEAALMLTWVCSWPNLVPDATFDMQHDNLCVTGAVGAADSPNRQGIAVPDLHYAGIYQQGVEPWEIEREGDEVWEDFAEDGELDPRVATATPQGAAAWVKFDLTPGETKEVPFVLVWHFPFYAAGTSLPGEGQPRYYTQLLGRRRPDNAIVWLAEQAVQHFGAETAQYIYWMRQTEDWQRGLLEEPGSTPAEAAARINALAALVEADTQWTEDGRIHAADMAGLRAALERAAPLSSLWPDVARQIGVG